MELRASGTACQITDCFAVQTRDSSKYLVKEVPLGHKVFLEDVLVEVVGRADAPLHAAAGHLNHRRAGAVERGKLKHSMG